MRSDCDRCVEINDCDRCADMINDYNRCVDILHFKPTCNKKKYLDQRLQSLCRYLTLQTYMQQQIYSNNASKYRNTHNCLNKIIKPTCKRSMAFFQERAANPDHSGNESNSCSTRKFLLLLRRIRDRRTILQDMNYISTYYRIWTTYALVMWRVHVCESCVW